MSRIAMPLLASVALCAASLVPVHAELDVARLKAAGGLMLGKTATTQFAMADPPATRNPWKLDRTPGGSSKMTTCAIDPLDVTVTICSTTSQVFVRGTGNSKFTNVTTPLTTITLSTTDQLLSGCTQSTVSLFDPCLQDYFWQYDNNGLKDTPIRTQTR